MIPIFTNNSGFKLKRNNTIILHSMTALYKPPHIFLFGSIKSGLPIVASSHTKMVAISTNLNISFVGGTQHYKIEQDKNAHT